MPAEPVATEEPPLRVAVVAGQNEGPADVASAESAADLVADEGGGEAPAAVVVQLPDVDGDADPMPVDDREAEAEGSLQLLTRVAEKLETRVAELEARIDAVRLAAETAAAEAATACADARVAVEHGTRLEGELAVARQPEQALRVELERLAAAAEQSLAQRELQERLVRTRLLELEQRLDSSNTARG
ncbi:MAG TPA: hypothetical protein VLN26_06850 [Gaiellaceae bacterium]|nr:hypothetical protein [Gaiellaceae bacterium]